MLLLTSSWKKTVSYFFIVFLNNAKKYCAPSIESLFPYENFLHGKILPRNPSRQPPSSTKQIPWKRLYTSQ